MPKKTPAKKAFRFPKTFTATVTKAMFNASQKRKDAGKNWGLMHDCPVSVAVRRALKLPRFGVSTSQVDCAVHTAKNARYRRYTHDGLTVVRAFDQQLVLPLPQTVTFTLAPKEVE
jgi:hypothetical protein